MEPFKRPMISLSVMGDATEGEVFPDILPVKEKIVGLQRGHRPRVLKRRQVAGRCAAGERSTKCLAEAERISWQSVCSSLPSGIC